jgi:diguanylate cyclase (GGDEF)-like protein/PAS domain S-box-containing protein
MRSEPRPAGAWWRAHWGTLATALAVYVLTYVAWRASGAGDDRVRHVVARLVFLPLNAAAVLAAWHAARRHAGSQRAGRALRLIAAAYLFVLAGNLVAAYVGLVLGGDPGVSWINIFYFPFYPVLLLGLLSFPLARREPHEHRKFVLDALAVLLGGGVAIWYLVVWPTTQANHLSPVGSAIALAYPLGDLLLLMGLTGFVLRRPVSGDGRWVLAIGALAMYTMCDLVNDLVFLEVGWFGLPWTDFIYLATYCALIVGLAHFEWPSTDDTTDDESGLSVQPFSPLPYTAVAFNYGLMLVVAFQAWPAPLSVLAIGGMGMTVLIFVRQIAAVRENAELRAQQAVRENEARFRSLVQHSSDVIAIVDADAVLRFVSPSMTRIFGYQVSEMLGARLTQFLHPDDVLGALDLIASAASEPGATARREWRVRHRDGHWLHAETAGTNLLDEPTVRGIVLNTRDISERKALEAQLTHQAFHDPLTGLANRVLLLDRVGHALTVGRRQRQTLAVLFLDLDDFKVVNDSLGHAAGDRLLVTIAGRLRTCVRDCDTVARIGGDEFAILIEDATDEHSASMVAERIATALRRPIVLEGQDVFMTASIGIATATDEATAADLLRNADMAMYVAKSQGKGRHERFEPHMHANALDRLELQSELRHALDRGDQFTMLYQPIVKLRTGEVTGVEALVRWVHPTRGLLTPTQFIPLAEETGLIVPLGRWVIREACRQVQHWQRSRPGGRPLTLTVNVSGYQLQYEHVVEDVRGALADSGLDPQHLVLEITESVLMQQNGAMLERLRALKATGVRLAIDDFGTGYSSLGYLQRFPIDILKIDKAFIDDVQCSGTDSALVRAIIALGDTLKLQTIAEGIELQQQLSGLQAMGCEMGQGFFLARPIGVPQIEALLASANGGPAVVPLSAPATP